MTQRERVLKMLRNAGERGVRSDEYKLVGLGGEDPATVAALLADGAALVTSGPRHSPQSGQPPGTPDQPAPSLAAESSAPVPGDARLFELPAMSAITNREAA